MQDRHRIFSTVPPSSVTSAVVIPNLNCSHLHSLQRASRLTVHLQPNYCDVWSVTPNILLSSDLQFGGLAACKVTANQCECLRVFAAAAPRGYSARVCHSQRVTLGKSVLALSHRGNPLLSSPLLATTPNGGESSATQSPLTAPEAAALLSYL